MNVNFDGDLEGMVLIDGGMHGTLNPLFAASIQTAQWPSLIDRPTGDNEAHYFDFVLDVHQPVSGTVYHGYVAYEEYQLRVFTDRYELWNDATSTLLTTVSQSTVGRRNIGLRAGQNSGVWVDGTQIIGGGIPLKSKPRAGFGARALSVALGTPAITLFENLCYTRAFNRTEFSPSEPQGAPGTLPPGMPRVTTTFTDVVAPTTSMELRDNAGVLTVAVASDFNGDATSNDQITADGRNTQIYLPNGRRTTAHVVEDDADGTVATGDGTAILAPGGLTTVGVRFTLLTDAVGHTHVYTPVTASKQPGNYLFNGIGDMVQTGLSATNGLALSSPVDHSPCSGFPATVAADVTTAHLHCHSQGQQFSASTGIQMCGGQMDRALLDDWLRLRPNGETTGGTSRERKDYFISILVKWFNEISTTWRNRGMTEEEAWALTDRIHRAICGLRNPNASIAAAERRVWVDKRTMTPEDWERIELIEELEAEIDALEAAADDVDILDWVGRKWVELHPFTQLKRFLAEGLRRNEDFVNGNIADFIMGRDFWDKATSYAAMSDMHGKDIGLVGGFFAALNDSLTGVGDMGDAWDGSDRFTGRALGMEERLDRGHAGGSQYVNSAAAIVLSRLSTGQCFVAGTLVLVVAPDADPQAASAALARGESPARWCVTKPVEEVRPGDWVLSYPDGDPNAPLTFSRVDRAFINQSDVIVEVATVNPCTGAWQVIETTEGHPFWVSATSGGSAPLADPASPHMAREMTYLRDADGTVRRGEHGWVFATDLQRGYTLETAGSAPSVVIGTRHKAKEATPVYNFRVSGTHTYFVLGTSGNPSVDDAAWVHNQNAKVPQPNSGKGRVPKSQRDPKRLFTPAERAAKRAAQGDKCANCGTKIDGTNSRGHHVERHADGGKTVSDNHVEVCDECHKDLHSSK